MRVDAAAYGHGLSVLSDCQGVELAEVDLNAVVHLSQRDESAMVSIVSKNGDIILVCEGNLAYVGQLIGSGGVNMVGQRRTHGL
jgi:hypothetical protein